MRRFAAYAALLVVLSACTTAEITGPGDLTPPFNLTYQLIPSGDPDAPEGIRLRWEPPDDGRVADYVVYSRGAGGDWVRRAETTSASFDDLGAPDAQYYVTSQSADGVESDGSNVVTIDPAERMAPPSTLSSISLDGAVRLAWSSDARLAAPELFDHYRVYSTRYDLDRGTCDPAWALEGTTVSEDFIASGLPNGVPRCFAVSTISRDGHESDWTTPRDDTPRYDARNVLLRDAQDDLSASGFSFFVPSTGTLGAVLSGSRTDIDFRVDRASDGSMWMTPVRSGTSVTLYGSLPVDDLTSIDYAPLDGYSTAAIEAVPGYGYVYETRLSDGLHYGAVRVTAVGADYVILDWAYQTDYGNPELRTTR
ncbi:MAG TPA: hypothetical protein VFS44_04980 [Gemmatimonadaceae bacterium]|nr:hypothetical protein [Gemmatimonadaceae bacterium]